MYKEPTQPTQSTQPSTQPVIDPRRIGRDHSGLNEKDVTDILAILHPASPGAIKIVEDAAENRRQHVLLRNPYDSYGNSYTDIEEQETIIIDRPGVRSSLVSRAGADLALRMSSQLIKHTLGFVFGRNPSSSDVVFGQDGGRRISNQHFRIFLNPDGILMLEDMSTNGTVVDEVLLKCRDPAKFQRQRMLESGTIICIQCSNAPDADVIKFIVRIPPRLQHMDRFQENLLSFMARCAANEEELKALQRLSKQQNRGPTMKWDGGDHYNIIGQVGKGAFATVHQLATKMEGKLLAAKELEKRRFMKNGQLDRKVDNEMKIMKDLRHPNVVEFVEYHDLGEYLYIIMEYIRHGDLQGYLNLHGSLKEEQAKTVAQQILSALCYLHEKKITHRDIKPDNILIAEVDPLRVKLSDFGLSKHVKQDDTFLKTFCGTLLYCAPEVFPDYDGKAPKGTKRRRGTKQQFHSYSSSVDIYSFAAVLWFSLCGKPPFEGISDATGRAMYENIMSTRLDTTPLRKANVSDACIDLLCKMLQKDPALRPTDRECLNHPWLRNGDAIPEDPMLQSIIEEDESEDAGEKLSQLSLGEIQGSEDEANDILEDEEFELLVNQRAAKKIRIDPLVPRNQVRDFEGDSSIEPSFHDEQRVAGDGVIDESFKVVDTNPGRQRLFGEISKSALQSPRTLNARASEAPSAEGDCDEPDDFPLADYQEAQIVKETPPSMRSRLRLNNGFSSPSLLGAESLVRELNMASPHSPVSGAQSPNEPATPKTPEAQHSFLGSHSQHQSQFSDATPKARPPVLNRQISIPKTASLFYDPYDPSTHNPEYASKVSGIDFVGTNAEAGTSNTLLPDTVRFSTESEQNSHSTTENGPAPGLQGITLQVESVTSGVVPSLPPELVICPPPRRLGKLIATSDSFAPNLTLMIDQSSTSWGRHPENTLVYQHSHDTRVPKRAFIIFWYTQDAESNTIKKLSQEGKDWTSLSGLQAGIFTCATSGISINGKHLKQRDEKGRAQYGHLHNGDIIQVYHDARRSECLKFRCEFNIGFARVPRPSGESFEILYGKKLAS